MNGERDESFEYTSTDAILVEFTSSGVPIDDAAKRVPRLGRPSREVLEERSREAARFLRELNEPRASEAGGSSDTSK